MPGLRVVFVACAGALAIASSAPPPAFAQKAPENIDDAIAIVAKITDPDPARQDELKARAAFNMVTDRIKILNDKSGWVFQRIPWDPLESTCRHASLSIL